MRSIRRVLIALALSFSTVPFFAGSAMAAPIDNSNCSQWLRIIDISSYQPSVDWGQVSRSGIAGAYIKISEGTGYTNPYAGSQRAGSSSVGLPWGGYDFAAPSGGIDQAIAEADYFVRAGGGAGTLPPMLDLEQSQLNPTYTAIWASYWLAEVKAKTGRQPIVYTGAYYPFTDAVANAVAPQGYPLWIAAYGLGYNKVPNGSACNVPAPRSTSSWPSWSIWQYTSVGDIPGINGNVDVSAVTPQWWASATGGTVQPPTPGTNVYPAPVYDAGSSGTTVIDIQKLMQGVGLYSGGIDGIYGPGTKSAVAQWQTRLNLAADGIWGPQTKTATQNLFAFLASRPAPAPAPSPQANANVAAALAFIHFCTLTTVQSGSSGACVKFLQADLNGRGLPLAQDSSFGPATRQAVIAFQHAHGLTADGIVGPATWKALIS